MYPHFVKRAHISRLLLPGCMILALTVILFKALFTCRFFLGGDSVLFVRDVGVLSRGYLQTNLEALRTASGGQATPHVQLATEGGFIVILWLVSHLGWQAPFCINAVFVVGAVAGLRLLFRELVRGKPWADLATGLVLLLLVVAPVYDPLLNLAQPFRDTSALCFSLWGLYLLVAALRVGRGRTWRLCLSGLLLGLATWLRMPNILLAAPAGLYLLWHAWLQARDVGGKQRIGLAAGLVLWGAMVMIGPGCVAAQGILETGELAVPGRANAALVSVPAVRTADPAAAAPHVLPSGVRKGLHAENMAKRLVGVWRQIVDNQVVRNGWVAGVVLLIGALACRRVLLGLMFALPLILLYGCYDKVVLRYNIPAILLVGGALSCSIAAVLHGVFRRIRRVRRVMEGPIVGTVALAIAAGMSLPTGSEVAAFAEQHDSAGRTVAWIRDTMATHEAVVTSWTGLAAFMSIVSPETFVVQEWVSHHLWDRPNQERGRPRPRYFRRSRDVRAKFGRIVDLLNEGGRALLIVRRTAEGQESASWVKDDLMHSFHLSSRPELSVVNVPHRMGHIAYEIEPGSLGARRVQIPVDDPGASLLLVRFRSLEGDREFQAATVTVADHEVGIDLEPGMNLVPVPGIGPAGTIELESPAPLPSIVQIHPMGLEPVLIDCGDYGRAPSNIRMVAGFWIDWSGYDSWFRDWGGDGRRSHRSHPHFFLRPDTDNRLKLARPIRPYVVRLTYRVGLHECPDGWESGLFRYSLSGRDAVPVQARAYPEDGDYILRHELDIAAVDGDLPSQLGIAMNAGFISFAELTSVEVMLRPSLELSTPSSLAPVPSIAHAVHEDPPLVRVAAPKDLRFLGQEPVGFDWPPSGNGTVTILAFVHDSRLALPVRVFCRWGSRSGVVDLPAEPGMVVAALARVTEMDDGIAMRIPGHVPGSGVYAVRLGTLDGLEPGMPPSMGVAEGEVLWRYFADGFYNPHVGPKREAFCWTSGQVTLNLPVCGTPRDVDAVLEVAGAPAAAGPLAVTMVVNGHTLPSASVQPDMQTVLTWQVSSDLLQEGMNRVVFTVPTWQPSVVLGTADERELGVMFRRLSWK